MSSSTRRGFLKAASTSAAAALALSKATEAWAASAGPVKTWGTYRDRHHAAGDTLTWKPVTEVASDAITLDPSSTRQEMLGFGAALTDASCYVFSQMKEDQRAAILHELFDPGEMNMTVCRTCVGSSDYSTEVFSYDEGNDPDPELKRFSIDHDKKYVLPVLRQVRKINPDLFLFSSPWSPPAWMKFNKSMLGGTIRKSSLEPYSRYFQKFLEGYKAEGVEINAITIQNETDTTVDGRYPACLFSAEDEVLLIGRYMGPLFKKNNITTKIWILDHNYNLWGRAIGSLMDHDAYEFIDGVAWHGYAGEPSGISQVHNAFPDKHNYFTEGGPRRIAGAPPSDPLTSWAPWAEWANDVVRNWSRSITMWNIALDEFGTPYIGQREGPGGVAAPASEQRRQRRAAAGVVGIDSQTHEVTRSARLYALAHYTKHVKRGAKVFNTNGFGATAAKEGTNVISHSGYRNPDGSMVVVLSNRGPQKRVQLLLSNSAVEVDLPADSVYTLQWS